MADRKLYHLVNGEFVLNGMPSVHVPTYAEVNAHIAMLRDVGFFDNPIAESVPAWDGLSNGKRTTEKQASLYDAMLAEIYAERDGNKAKVRNRRRNDHKHNVLPKVRKQMRYDRGWNRYRSMPCYGCKNIGIAEYRMDNAEYVARADWEIESAAIAEEEEWDRFNAELLEFDRKWREQAEAEQRKMREYRKLRELNEWLKWA